MPDPVVLVERAAGLAEQAAAKATGQSWVACALVDYAHAVYDESGELIETVYTGAGNANLIAASGPDHWQAVAELLRGVLAAHKDDSAGGCVCCGWESDFPCITLHTAVPLSLLIVNQLGSDNT